MAKCSSVLTPREEICTVGGIKTVMFPSCPIPFKRKCMPVPFNRKTGMEREAEQATNGATDYANRS